MSLRNPIELESRNDLSLSYTTSLDQLADIRSAVANFAGREEIRRAVKFRSRILMVMFIIINGASRIRARARDSPSDTDWTYVK